MGKRKKKHAAEKETVQPAESETPEAEVIESVAEGEILVEDGDGSGEPVEETPEETIERLTDEVASQKDAYLRLAAEFANFRNRRIKERSETWTRAQADLMGTLLDSIDDLARVAELDHTQASVADVASGVELVERKLLRELASKGLERTGAEGERFDPNYHEAVAATPALSEEQEGQVATVFQVGYKFGKTLLRPARVQVYVEAQPDGGPEA